MPPTTVGVAFVPVSNAADVEERSETKRLASTLAESTPLGVTRQSARTPAELRVLSRGEAGNWNCWRNGRANVAPVPAAVAL